MPSPYKDRQRIHACPVEGCDYGAVYPKDLKLHLARAQGERDRMGQEYKLVECQDCGKKWCTRGCKTRHQCEGKQEEEGEEERRRRIAEYVKNFNAQYGGHNAWRHQARILHGEGQTSESKEKGKAKLSAEEQAEFVREFNARYGHRNAHRHTRASVEAKDDDIDAIIEEQEQHEIALGLRGPGTTGGQAVLSEEQRQAFAPEFNARYGQQNATAAKRPTAPHDKPPSGDGEDDIDAIIEAQQQHERALGLHVNNGRHVATRGGPVQQRVAAGNSQPLDADVLEEITAAITAQQHHQFVRAFYARHGQQARPATTTPPQQTSSRARQSRNVTGIDGSGLLEDPFVDPAPSFFPQTPSRRRKREEDDEEELTPASKQSYPGVPYDQRRFICPNTPCEYAANKKHTLDGHLEAAARETAKRGGQTHVPCMHCRKQFCTRGAVGRHDCDALQDQLEQAGELVESEAAPDTSSNHNRQRIFMSDAELDAAIAHYDRKLQQSAHPSPAPFELPMETHQDPLLSLLRSPSPYIKPEATPEPPLPGPDRIFPSTSTHKPLALGPSSDTGHWVYDALEKDYPLLSSELMAQMVYSVEMGPLQYVWPSDVVYLRKLPRLAALGENIQLVWEEGKFDVNRRSEWDVLMRGRLRHLGMEKEQIRVKGALVEGHEMGEKEAEEFVWGEEFVAGLYERANRGELDPSVQEAEGWFAEEVRMHEEKQEEAMVHSSSSCVCNPTPPDCKSSASKMAHLPVFGNPLGIPIPNHIHALRSSPSHPAILSLYKQSYAEAERNASTLSNICMRFAAPIRR
ncbi:uncharacterized protein MYCFIDRAFT_176055 [Pseudocercospora fijiensis CIRAD86]|uniref:Uncharacterized protein n=1 Tax=Pseudocercospora fijiensis (strain CIRAD86) TaxID=383855 RepID=M3AZ68_PSEFD|nr:uncharacterized protein MYCFIDRAFT_176055 [Pseudocercospora fijiensis CIRAD86]EME82507.1 hypothetical protein MYCFIDRAFT_176055 [Pseudocercospora fijiensis CIRAD86]